MTDKPIAQRPPSRQKSPVDEIEVRMQAELAALDNRAPEVISRERRLDDLRLEKHRELIRGARDASLKLWGTQFEIPDRPAPVEHPLIAKLRAKKRDEPSIDEMAEHVAAAYRKDRMVAAGGMLIELKRRHEDMTATKGGGETWWGFVKSRFSFSPEQADQLMGALLHRSGMLKCMECGKEQICPCGCGKPYLPERVTKSHEKSDAGAEETGEAEMPKQLKRIGRPPSDRPMTGAERKRRQRARQRGSVGVGVGVGVAEPVVEIAKGKILVDPAYFEQEAKDPTTPEIGFENSLTQQAGLAQSLPAYWRRHLGDWENLPSTSVMRKLAKEAAKTWAEIATKLDKRRK
jgi:hypothetical protein